jgi:hypothetical protein
MWPAASGLCESGGNRPKHELNRTRTPVDKARSAAKLQEEKNKELDDALKKQ